MEIISKKKWFFVILILVNISCIKKENKNYSYAVCYYKLGFLAKNNDTMHVNFEKKHDSLIFKYNCQRLKMAEDVLETNNDTSVYFQKTKLTKVDVKTLKIADSTIIVEKYINIKNPNPHALSDIYFNRKLGLILVKNLTTNGVVEYDTEKFKDIHKLIIKDTVLFKNSMEIIKVE